MKMSTALALTGIILASVLYIPRRATALTQTQSTQPDAVSADATHSLPWLDGIEKSILINGYSTSYAWPDMLQDMLDEHTDHKRIYHILNAVIGGSPVQTWIDEPGSEGYERTVTPMLRDFFGENPRLRNDAPPPTIALCQQSLQFTFDLRGPVKNIQDEQGITIGADAIEKLALRLHGFGIEHVIIGMHIYKKPVEPEVGNERFALKALLRRGHDFIHEGPDTWSLTIGTFPDSYSDDELHPNELGMKIMAEAWYRTLAGDDAKQEVIDNMRARAYDVNTMMREYLNWRRGNPGE